MPENQNMPNKDKNRKPGLFGPQNDDQGQMKNMRSIMIWLIIIAAFASIYLAFNNENQTGEWPVPYSQYTDFLNNGMIRSAKIIKSSLNDYEFHGELREPAKMYISGQYRDVKNFVTKLGPVDSSTEKLWESKSVSWTYEAADNTWIGLLSFLPWIVLIVFFVFFLRRMQNGGAGGSKGLFSFGKARVKMQGDGQERVTFDDVAGADEAKYELQEIIEFLKEPGKFRRLGGKIPRGVLLLGPPGTGKTLLARAVAGEAGVPFFSISGADFVEMFVGVGASRVRDLFDQAKKSAPCLVFIDEIDAVGRQRGAGLGGGHDEREQTLNQLLVEMDGFEQNSGVIIIAATNRPDVLDPALLRPGRFDRQVVVDRPDVKGREGIFKVHSKRLPLAEDVNLEVLSRGTPGFSGADIANLVNEAALLAARRNSQNVTMYDFENAKDKVMMGTERRSMVLSDKEKENTAYHEMGHALLGKFLDNSDPVHKVTIIPRGMALGLTSYLPVEDHHTYTKEYMETRIAVALGGRAAEMIIFNQLSTGAANDLEQATKIARKMVCDWGMSEAVGPVKFAGKHEEVFLGREISQPTEHSELTAQLIDSEVRKILLDQHELAMKTLTDNIEVLHSASKILLEREVLDGEELDKIIKGETLEPFSKHQLNAMRSIQLAVEENAKREDKTDSPA